MMGMPAFSTKLFIALGITPGISSAYSGLLCRTLSSADTTEPESIMKKRWTVPSPASLAMTIMWFFVLMMPSAPLLATNSTPRLSLPMPSAMSMCT